MENKVLAKLGTIAASISAILAMLWFIGEPALEDYVKAQIKIHEERQKEVNSKKVKLRTLLSDKMNVADDEVHIELGKAYKHEKKIKSKLDSLEKEVNLNARSMQLNYKDIKVLTKRLNEIH